MVSSIKKLWIDCDPGHDDAIALALALNIDEIELLGVSTVNGNSKLENCHINAARLLALYRAKEGLPLHRGHAHPLLEEKYNDTAAVSIHGQSGLDGVELLPPISGKLATSFYTQTKLGENTAVSAMANAIRSTWNGGKGEKVYVAVTGPSTNAAALMLAEEELCRDAIEAWVVMGGAFGIPQWTPLAEFNVHTDPYALQVLLKPAPYPPVILACLNVTHQNLFTPLTNQYLLTGDAVKEGQDIVGQEANLHVKPKSDIRWTISTMLMFFAKTYRDVFNFTEGPPIHDALTVAWTVFPEMFSGRWCELEVGQDGEDKGETRLVPGTEWATERGEKGNCFVLEDLKHTDFWKVFLDCVNKAEKKVEDQPLE